MFRKPFDKLLLKLSLLALAFSLVFGITVINFITDSHQGPYFIDSSKIVSADSEIIFFNAEMIKQQNELNEKLRSFDDSLAHLMDSLSVRRGSEEHLIELLNLERNICERKSRDSVAKDFRNKLENRLKKIDDNLGLFSKKNNLQVLFASNNNTIIFGTGTRADKTDAVLKFFRGEYE